VSGQIPGCEKVRYLRNQGRFTLIKSNYFKIEPIIQFWVKITPYHNATDCKMRHKKAQTTALQKTQKPQASKQTLLEFAEHIAITKDNARYGRHSFVCLQFQRQLFNYIESRETFKVMPVAFASRAELDNWALLNDQKISTISNNISGGDAVISLGGANGPQDLNNYKFVWAKATSPHYRKALLAWMDTERDGDFQTLHREAATYCNSLINALTNKEIRKKISDTGRLRLINQFKYLHSRFIQASQSPQAAKNQCELLELLDRSLDADHVINRQSLKHLPNAWVLLAPVISGTNRKFGRMIERLASPFPPCTTSITLDPITALKLHAATIPTCQAELKKSYKALQERFLRSNQLTSEFNAVETTLLGLINGSIKHFTR